MELKKDIYEQYVCVFRGGAGRELSEETVVPDTLPDVGMVLDAQGMLCVRGKEAAENTVTISASVSVSVLYAPSEGGSVRSVSLEIPAELRIDAPGAGEDCRVCASVRLVSVEARAVNSRKLSVRAEIHAEAAVYDRQSYCLASGIEGDGAHIRKETASVMAAEDVREKTFVVTDEYAAPASLSGGVKIIAQRVEAVAEDVKYAAGKVIVRGRALSELTFSDDNGLIRMGRFTSEFSQIMEVDCAASEAVPSARLMLTGAYYDLPEYGEGAGRIQAELHFAVQCVCMAERKTEYIADVYSNRTVLEPLSEEYSAILEARPVSMRQTVAGRAEPEAEGELVILNASVGAVSVEDGAVRTGVVIRMASVSADGVWTPSKCRLSAEFTPFEPSDGAVLTDVSVYAADVYAAGSDVRAVLQMDAVLTKQGTIRSVAGLREDDEAFARLPKKPSVTLVRVQPGTPLFELARRCGSSVEAIAEANGGRRDGLLLIPKAK